MSMNSLSAPPPIQPLPPPYRERKPVPVLSPNDLSRNNGGALQNNRNARTDGGANRHFAIGSGLLHLTSLDANIREIWGRIANSWITQTSGWRTYLRKFLRMKVSHWGGSSWIQDGECQAFKCHAPISIRHPDRKDAY